MHNIIRRMNRDAPVGDKRHIQWEQGFVNQFGEFLTREEAWEIADAQGKVDIERNGGENTRGTLYSEGLY